MNRSQFILKKLYESDDVSVDTLDHDDPERLRGARRANWMINALRVQPGGKGYMYRGSIEDPIESEKEFNKNYGYKKEVIDTAKAKSHSGKYELIPGSEKQVTKITPDVFTTVDPEAFGTLKFKVDAPRTHPTDLNAIASNIVNRHQDHMNRSQKILNDVLPRKKFDREALRSNPNKLNHLKSVIQKTYGVGHEYFGDKDLLSDDHWSQFQDDALSAYRTKFRKLVLDKGHKSRDEQGIFKDAKKTYAELSGRGKSVVNKSKEISKPGGMNMGLAIGGAALGVAGIGAFVLHQRSKRKRERD